MRKVLAIASLALVVDIAAAGQQLLREREGLIREGLRKAQLISNVLATARASGSLEYTGRCGPGVLVPDLPPVREPQKPYPPNAADTLRYMFSVEVGMVVSQESNGIIRVVEDGVQTDILHVRINHLAFSGIVYPDQALEMVLGAPEVQSFIQSNSIGRPFNVHAVPLYALPGLNAAPRPGVPSISGELNNVTVATALDYILKTFPGFWLYQDCQSRAGQRLVYFGLFPVPGGIWLWENDTTSVKE